MTSVVIQVVLIYVLFGGGTYFYSFINVHLLFKFFSP